MKRNIFILISTAILFLAAACKKENPISDNPSLKLAFSTDTLLFDTVFTSLGSTTHTLMIYNHHNEGLKISSIRLVKGESSSFRLNVDGMAGTEIYDKTIPANDSLFSFLRVTINPNDLNTPFVVEDELEFVTNGNTQTVKLMAWGQNANYIVGDQRVSSIPNAFKIVADSLETTIWNSERPYVIYGYALINSYGTLRIEPGTHIYVHGDGGIFSWSEGQLIIEGTAENPVIIEGDRLEADYKDVPGQWDQIYLMECRENADHIINHAIIRNSFIGINCQSVLKATQSALRLSNTIIENQSGCGFYSMYFAAEMKNFVIANSGVNAMQIHGGDYRFVHGSITNYCTFAANNYVALSVDNYVNNYATNEVYVYPLSNCEFNNCIVYGKNENEISTSFYPDADTIYSFDHCLLKSKRFVDYPAFNRCIFNREPCFANENRNDFHLDSLSSAAIGMGNPIYSHEVPFDFDGISRVGMPDIGAFQYNK
ncbi:MAG: hypothetical protein HUK16_08850 [Bacteroidales bacterium]|nr:hypothetical protein [Bacteroidales bacterium]